MAEGTRIGGAKPVRGAVRAAAQEAARRNARLETWAACRGLLQASARRAYERLAELVEHEDPQVALAATHELLDRLPPLWTPHEERITPDDVQHDWERRRLRPRIWKGGQEALHGKAE